MNRRFRSILVLAGVPVLAIALAACGGSSNSSSTSSASTPATTATTAASGGAISVKSVSGVGAVLVDAQGNTLYMNNQDSGSKIACTGQCASIWPPVAAPSSGQPTSSVSSVQAKLGVVQRSDGSSQATFDGKPLYTFVQDGPGQATGDGVTDSFAGTSFTWTAATPGGGSGASSSAGASGSTTSSSPTPSTSTMGGSSSGGGGYGY
jgi:predicted lipoprotein with Yx(FWY)xxD motif